MVLSGFIKKNLYSAYIAQRKFRIARRGLPPILLNTMVNSGSMFLMRGLQNGLDARTSISICAGNDDGNYIHEPTLAQLADGHLLTYSHIYPSEYNRILLRDHLDRMVVHIRDPRQATLSYIRFVDHRTDFGKARIAERFFMPKGYFDLTLNEKIDYQLENWLPYLVKWSEGWLDADHSSDFPVRIMFTTHDSLVLDQNRVFERILEFFEIDPDRFTPPDLPQPGVAHFRKGQVDEWRHVFNDRQKDAANAQMPAKLLSRFNWTH